MFYFAGVDSLLRISTATLSFIIPKELGVGLVISAAAPKAQKRNGTATMTLRQKHKMNHVSLHKLLIGDRSPHLGMSYFAASPGPELLIFAISIAICLT